MRILWELWHQEDPITDDTLKNSRYMSDLSRDAAIMRAVAFRDIGVQIMRGNINYIDNIYNIRLTRLGEKALERTGVSHKEVAFVMNRINDQSLDGDSIIKYLSETMARYNPAMAERFENLANNLLIECYEVKKGILCKPDGPGGDKKNLEEVGMSPRRYSDEEVENFVTVVNAVIAKICKSHHITDQSEIREYEQMVRNGEFPPGTPFKRYDQWAEPSERRTIFPVEYAYALEEAAKALRS